MLDYKHLETLLAVKYAGSFEGAGQALGISPIGVSRRIKKLEERMGVTLLNRKPTRPSSAGETLCRYTEVVLTHEKQFLQTQKNNALQTGKSTANVKIAVNDDSLISWFVDVLKDNASSKMNALFDIEKVDQDHSIELIKSGQIVAALSTSKQPVHGYKVFYLGQISYRAVAANSFKERYFPEGVTLHAASVAPCVRYCNRDNLQIQWIEQVFASTTPVTAIRLPSSNALIDACLKGAAWGVIAEFRIRDYLADKSLIELMPGQALQKDLYWHVSSALAETLADVTSSVKNAARKHLGT